MSATLMIWKSMLMRSLCFEALCRRFLYLYSGCVESCHGAICYAQLAISPGCPAQSYLWRSSLDSTPLAPWRCVMTMDGLEQRRQSLRACLRKAGIDARIKQLERAMLRSYSTRGDQQKPTVFDHVVIVAKYVLLAHPGKSRIWGGYSMPTIGIEEICKYGRMGI